MKFMRKREESNPEEQETLTGRSRLGFSIGMIINLVISVDFLAVIVASLVVIGTVGTVQNELSGVHTFTTNTSCYLYSACTKSTNPNITNECSGFSPGGAHTCAVTMVGFAFVIVMGFAFAISLIVKAVLRHDLNWTVYIEVPMLALFTLFVFILGIIISVGIKVACDKTIMYNTNARNKYNSTCDGPYPSSQVTPYGRMNAAQSSAWFTFLFLFIALAVYISRLVIYLRRRQKTAIRSTIARENFEESESQENKPV